MNNYKSIRLDKFSRIRDGREPRILDLFAGAGGLSLGFLTAGFDIAGAVEIDSFATRTHALNLFKDQSEEQCEKHSQPRDITTVEPEQLLHDFGYDIPSKSVDVIIGGPPCQAFARVGRAKLREVADHPEAFLKDPRANLYLRFLHYVEILQPLAILMENVPDALNYGGHNIAEETCEVLTSMGYRCAYTMLNAAYFGVPQMRDRMFLLAYAEELDQSVEFPKPLNFIELPVGYKGSRSVALKLINGSDKLKLFDHDETFYSTPYEAEANLPLVVTARDALADLPPLYAKEMLDSGEIKRGIRDPMTFSEYIVDVPLTDYGHIMRNWRNFSTKNQFTGHIIRYLPRDYKLFARLSPGDQYPEAYQKAMDMFNEELRHRRKNGESILEESDEYGELLKEYVPPYDPGKFPNKWRKMEPDKPARTLMAHLGKDSYSHIHYDSDQARTLSVREAARLQSFPDGFIFSGKMNAAFKQIGNAVPPLLAYAIACQMKLAFSQKPLPICNQEQNK